MGTPPTGTVTLLFTDIEGSSRLWEAKPAAMRSALAHHDAHLRRAIEAHHGHVFKTVGDGFCAAFAAAPDALAAALEAQRALEAERWPEGAAIKVRMALNTGAVEHREGDYFGQPLNRVARLLTVGHGGQTLMTQATHDLARDHLPAGAEMRPLGQHTLKDLPRPESVFQLCHPALKQLFPPLHSELESLNKETPSIAVLPFVNMSRDEENEYFADGLSEELLNVLAKIKGLRVASRTSAFHFKGKDVDIPTIARKLNVATVLEGSVRKSGQRVRITAQLIEAASDSHLWTETYDRNLDDIFAVQDDIAQSVVKELRAALLGEAIDAKANVAAKAAVATAAAGRTEDLEAYRLYLQGRHLVERTTKDSIALGVAMLEQAVARDPSFAMGWAGLAAGYSRQAGYGYAPVDEGYAKARQAAQRALELEPDLPEAHVELGAVMRLHDFDWPGADAQLERALKLAPNSAQVLRQAAYHMVGRGRRDEACELSQRVTDLDPLSVSAWRVRALVHWYARRTADAAVAARTAIDLDPHAGLGYCYLSVILTFLGRAEEALEVGQREVGPEFRALALAIAHHALGHRDESRAAIDEMIAKYGGFAAYQIAEAMSVRGEFDDAFAWLERAYAQRDPGLSNTAFDPLFDPLHGDPRWTPFLRKMNLA